MSLTRRFAVTASVVVLASCTVLAYLSGERARQDVVASAAAYNVTLARVLASALWRKHDDYLAVEAPASRTDVMLSLLDPRLTDLDGDVRLLLAGSPVVKVKLFAIDGRVLYSTDHRDIATTADGNGGFATAARGEATSTLQFKNTFNSFDGVLSDRDVLESYVPIRSAPGTVDGVIEIYHDLTSVLAQASRAQHRQWAIVGGCMLVLLLLLIAVVWRSERAMQEADRMADAARREADAARVREQVKGELLANVSHELRSPLNAILGFAQIMQDRVFGPIEPRRYEAYVSDIVNSGGQLLRTIDDILEMTQIEANQIELLPTRVDLGGLLQRVATEAAAAVQQRDAVAIEVRPPAPPVMLLADEHRLRQALGNVIDNACKHAGAGSKVILSTSRLADGGIAVSVSDSGIGISADKLAVIQAPFGQVAGAYARETGGLGLGLPIAKAIVGLHGGALRVISTPGSGTTVTITLPPERVIGGAGGRATAEVA